MKLMDDWSRCYCKLLLLYSSVSAFGHLKKKLTQYALVLDIVKQSRKMKLLIQSIMISLFTIKNNIYQLIIDICCTKVFNVLLNKMQLSILLYLLKRSFRKINNIFLF